MITVMTARNVGFDFHIGACPISYDNIVGVREVQADGDELAHIYRTYPFLKEKQKMLTHDFETYPSSVMRFFGSDAQYAAESFLQFRKD